jgi:PAS domain S-box-containing protein
METFFLEKSTRPWLPYIQVKMQTQIPMIVDKCDGTSSLINITSVPITNREKTSPSLVVTTFADMTENQRIRSELEHTMNFIAVGIFQTDPDGNCIKVNNGWCQIAGISPEEALGQGWVKAIHPEDKEIFFQEWNSSVSQQRPFELNYRFLHKDNKIIHVLGRAKAITNSQGVTSGYLGSIEDISRLKETEEFNTFYKIALDDAAIVAMTDPQGKILYVNEMFCQISEYSREELIGKDHRVVNSGKMGKDFFKKMWNSISTGNQWNGKICNRSKSGKDYWVDTTIVPFKNVKGEILRYISIRRDITAEMLAQEGLRNKTNEINSFFSVTLDLLCVAGMDGIFKRVNPAFNKVLGYSNDDLLSQPFFNFIHPDDLSTTQKEVEKLATGLSSIQFENRYRCKNGTYKTLSWAAAPDNERKFIYAAARDVSDERKKRKELEQLTLNLDMALRKAEEATKIKSEFLSTMSHEIRTPLNGIIGMTDFLLESSLNQDQNELAMTISQSGKTLLTIINDILDFSKMEAGKLELEIIEFDLHQYIEEILKPFKYTALKKGISLDLLSNKHTHYLLGDQGRIGQVVTNLVSNAIKFTKDGGVKIESFFNNVGNRTDIILNIYDTGIGIPDHAKNRMFQAFT